MKKKGGLMASSLKITTNIKFFKALIILIYWRNDFKIYG